MAQKHILIAEDDSFLADAMQNILSKENLRITMTHDGEEAIAAMEKEQPDLLLLDILMPKLDGHGVLEHIEKKQYSFPIVILSNLSDSETQNRCKQIKGCKDFLVKSDMDESDLWPKIKKYL